MSSLLRSIRLLSQESRILDRMTRSDGSIYYDKTNQTLRLHTGKNSEAILATRDWVDNNTFSGSYTDLTNKPQLFSGSYADLTGKPTLFSGSYNDLADKPTIPSLTGYATETYVNTAISNLVDTAPATLNTLNELAAALNDDANFATTVTTALGTKFPLGSAEVTGNGSDINFSAADAYIAFGGTNTSALYLKKNGSLRYGLSLSTIDGVDRFSIFNYGTFSNALVLDRFTNLVTFNGSVTITGVTTLQETTEVVNTLTGATGTVAHNFLNGAVWVHTGIVSNFTANFTNMPTTDNRSIAVALIAVQGATPYIPNAVQIDGVSQTIRWLSNNVPTGNASKTDVISFTFLRTGSTWTVLGSLTTYG